MTVQPIVLNVVSIFVVGYIASALGQEDYGKFVLAFSLVALFMPVCTLGLRAVQVRDMAADRDNALELFGKYFVLSMVLSCVAYALLVVVVNSLDYPPITKIVIYIAGLNLFFKTVSTTFFGTFQAYERMQYIAYINFISGALLTLFSVLAIYFGYRLVGITVVYAGGTVVLFVAIAIYYRIHFRTLRLSFDRAFWMESIKKGFPFFLAAMIWMLNLRIGIVLLSKMSGDAAVGVYGAAFNIVSRLYVFPDSIGTAIFPTIAFLYAQKDMAELRNLCEKFLRYVLLMGLPVATGLAVLSPQVIDLIYGDQYTDSATVLTIMSCGIPFLFTIGLLGFGLGAVHLQSKVLTANIVSVVVNIVATALLIPFLHENGAAAGYAASQLVTSAILYYYFRKFLPFDLKPGVVAGIILANALMAVAVYAARDINLLLAILVPGLLYLGLIVLFRAVNKEDLLTVRDALFKRKKKQAPAD
jgi:O-antigen/teichoic acid export membrane protein